tara:strand:+ start:2603 stop:2839 length:237 start_codon:yes stop_codon:yes gene_type:complete
MDDPNIPITEEEAVALYMGRLTTPYSLPNEQSMLDSVIKDMKRGNIDYRLVKVTTKSGLGKIEVWRTGIKKDWEEAQP